MAGVRIGSGQRIHVTNRRDAEVNFDISSERHLASTVTATIRFRNLVGQRYIELDQGAGSPEVPWPSSRTIGLTHHAGAGSDPAVQRLPAAVHGTQPKDINELSYEIIQIFQGEGDDSPAIW